jgi:signal recognition particle receptor subunit alpha
MDCFTVLHKGGAVLWKKELNPVKGNPVNELIKTVLLEERSSETVFKHETYQLKWKLVNEFDLVFVVVYAGAVTMLLVDELLDSLKTAFIKLFKDSIRALPAPSQKYDFEKEYQRIMQRHELKVQFVRVEVSYYS